MGSPNYPPDYTRRWTDAQTGILNSSLNSVADYRHRNGEFRSSNDLPMLAYRYTGVNTKGRVVRPCNPPGVGTYVPTGTDGGSAYHNPLVTEQYPPEIILAQNKSWAKLMEKVKGDTSSLAVAAAESVETFGMVAKRVTGLYRAYKSLRKGDFRKFLKELSVDPKRKHRSKIRSTANEASGIWLEYWFGWSPTIQEIGASAQAMSNNPVLSAVRETASAKFKLPHRTIYAGAGDTRRDITQGGTGVFKQGATFELLNANLFLDARLGLINPASVAWELVPFSFVVDWFTDYGSYLDGFTDLVGLRYFNEFSTMYAHLDMHTRCWYEYNPVHDGEFAWDQHYMRREVRLTRPLPVTPRLQNFGDSLTRAATAVSLLTQIFLSGK